MGYKGILLDIDDTLYDYDRCHKEALATLISKISKKTDINTDRVVTFYQQGREEINSELAYSASSHNRLLYIQRTLEKLNINSMNLSLQLYDIYWNSFLSIIKLESDALEFLESHKAKPICLVTDLTAHIQHRKIEKLKLYKYANYLVTSEESGREKPHPYIFMLALKKVNLQANEVCMIGDNYKKDILGATSLGIDAFWLNRDHKESQKHSKTIVQFQNFDQLKGYI